jgi:hypothetical protein
MSVSWSWISLPQEMWELSSVVYELPIVNYFVIIALMESDTLFSEYQVQI